jgi:hypothetical protein
MAGKHRTTPPPVSDAELRAQQQQYDRDRRGRRAHHARQRQVVRGGVRAPGRAARAVTVRKGGQHALMAEFLVFAGIVALRTIADYVPGDQGQPTEGTTKGTVTPAKGQSGPLTALAAGFVIFFVLSFLAARGGTQARVAALIGLIIDTVLLMRSLPELETMSQGFGNARTQAQQAPYPGTYVQPVGYEGTATVPEG